VNDNTALEVLANVDAMAYAIADRDGEVTVERIVEIHRRLLAPTRVAAYAGAIRTEQNWIGGSDFNPLSAHYVPPPAEEVPRLLMDLCAFCNSDALPAVAQAAIAHAQFESIHPFADGNGRTGRALIHIVLRRRGLGVHATPPVSLVLATRAKDYIGRLDATRVDGPVSSPKSSAAANSWIAFFAAACVRAVSDAESFEQRVTQIQSEWRSRVAGARADSAARALLEHLPEAPVITVNAAAKLLGRSFVAANRAVEALVSAKILAPTRIRRRNRTFEARELINAFNGLERQLASPTADTRVARPTRPVPARPPKKELQK
jgi:Fic family protein